MNTPTRKYNRKRVTGMLVCWSAYALTILWLSCQSYRVMMIGVITSSVLTSLLSMYFAWRPLKITALIVAAAMILYPVPVNAQDNGGNEGDFSMIECLVAVVVIGVGVVLTVGLCKMAKKIPKNPPRDPDEDPPCTNSVPHTNTPPVGPKIKLHLSDAQLSVWDCSTNQLANTDPQGNPYQRWSRGLLESSRDNVHWSNVCSIHSWASDYNLCSVIYDQNGQPYSTNFSSLAAGTNVLCLPSLAADPKAMFFRLRDE